ncbi:DUF4150 domain-containing protein [Methylibium rhizosphaerae]|uniref:DUF4150 domain-containing protein n=1 Tax=Methylibium rhizosphaerae TaxID=2570323 RepID=UPI00112CFCBA|nr:DUF4150 domain-containing protein [Methylibium rhizosphaerae]
MADLVFANSREISSKSMGGKSICAFPDVCFTPPMTPATPTGLPIPYPNTGMAKDCTDGSRTVKISAREVMLKNKSCFKTSVGDEGGCAPKKGVISARFKGKVYFNSWSMDVKIEGENVVRHLDLTTHNHASQPPQTPVTPHAANSSPAASKPSPTYGLRRDTTQPCASNGQHQFVCDKDVCADCWDPKCDDNERILESEYRQTQGASGDDEQAIAAKGIAAVQAKIDKGAGDVAGLEFEKAFIAKVAASGKHKLHKIGYKVHCMACHLRVDIDIVTDKYVVEVKRNGKSFKKAQLEDNIIPAARACFPNHKVACATEESQMDRFENDKLIKWDIGVEGFRP